MLRIPEVACGISFRVRATINRMKNPYIIPSLIIAAAILGGFWMLKPSSEPQKVTIVQPPKAPNISIHMAVNQANIEAVKQHLAAGTHLEVKDKHNLTPLRLAAAYDHKEIVELLLANGANVNALDYVREDTPLHDVASRGHKEIAALLIDNGADVNAKDIDGTTPLDLALNHAALLGDRQIADLLRKHGGKTGEELKAEGK